MGFHGERGGRSGKAKVAKVVHPRDGGVDEEGLEHGERQVRRIEHGPGQLGAPRRICGTARTVLQRCSSWSQRAWSPLSESRTRR